MALKQSQRLSRPSRAGVRVQAALTKPAGAGGGRVRRSPHGGALGAHAPRGCQILLPPPARNVIDPGNAWRTFLVACMAWSHAQGGLWRAKAVSPRAGAA
jgi:hypothetical protein